MRLAAVLLAVAAPNLIPERAAACPETANRVSTDEGPVTARPCMQVDFGRFRQVFELGYAVGAGGTSQTGVGQAAAAFAAVDLGYAIQFGSDPQQPSYEIVLGAAGALQQSVGDVSATGVFTRGEVQFGPAPIRPAVLDDGRHNYAVFPASMELAHAGEIAAVSG